MSRSGRSGRVRFNPGRERDYYSIANQRLRLASLSLEFPGAEVFRLAPLRQFEDRRTWHPLGAQRPARSFTNAFHRLKAVRRMVGDPVGRYVARSVYETGVPRAVGFVSPSRVLVCVRRKMRKAVLHAFGFTGKGSGGAGRRSEYSSISCRG